MPVMRKRNPVAPSSTSGNLVEGSDFEFVTDSIVSLWATSGGFLTTVTFQAGTTVLGRDLAVNVRPELEVSGAPTNPNFNNVLAEDDVLIRNELIEGTARLTLVARNTDADATRSIKWMIEVQPIG